MSEVDTSGATPSSTPSPYPPPQAGTWTLTAPDGRTWTGPTPLDLARQENSERVPAEERLRRLMRGIHEWLEEGIWLRGAGATGEISVLVEHDGQWVKVISENISGPISHIVEKAGINSAILEAV